MKLHKINGSELTAVALDGSRDSANIEDESYFISYLDEDKPSVDFVKIIGVDRRATTQNLADGFFATFSALDVNVKRKCVQLATDGPHVMKNMCRLVRNEIKWLLEFHCTIIPPYNDVHSLLDRLYHFYDNSNLQSRCLKKTAELLGVKSVVHPTAKCTRWVAHREQAVKALDRNYVANAAQLQECNLDNT